MGWFPVNKVKIERLTEPRVIRVVVTNDVVGDVIHDYPYEGRPTQIEMDAVLNFVKHELFQIAM